MIMRATVAWLCLVGVLCSLASAQRGPAQLELGFNGELVTGRWNPLRLSVRDVPSAELVITLDQGSLRGGESLALYRSDVDNGGGVSVFEDDLYLPQWRQLTWSLQTSEGVLASGTFDRRHLDPRPLTLLVSATPNRWRTALGPELRSTELPPSLLPERLAAYDGVDALLIDGSAAMPDLEALVSAAAAGTKVILIDPLPSSHDPLGALVGAQPERLGAGWLLRSSAEDLEQRLGELASLPDLSLALLTEDMGGLPAQLEPLPLFIAVGVYLLAVLMLIRLAGAPGLAASLALAVLASVAAWSYLRPGDAQAVQGRSLLLGGGDLAKRSELRTLFTLPQQNLQLTAAAYPVNPVPYERSDTTFELDLGRWSSEAIIFKPRLSEAALRWDAARLVNAGSAPLQDVYVKGIGSQNALAPGDSLRPAPNEDAPLPEVYTALLEALPFGSALARDGGTFHVSLPPPPTITGMKP